MSTILLGDCLQVLETFEAETFDACVTDPPYGIRFMGKAWDGKLIDEAALKDVERRCSLGPHSSSRAGRTAPRSSSAFGNRASQAGSYDFSFVGNQAFQVWCEQWARAVLRVLKPGAHLLAFGGARTYHRMVCAIEDAGFEIRDSIDWIYGTGFPKSIDGEREAARCLCEDTGRHFLRKLPAEHMLQPGDHVCKPSPESEQFDGVGSGLKPAHEPIVVARKPFSGTLGANLLRSGTGGLQVDACRLGAEGLRSWIEPRGDSLVKSEIGRWPPNVLLSHMPDCRPLDWNVSVTVSGHWPTKRPPSGGGAGVYGGHPGQDGLTSRSADGESVQAWQCVPGCPVAELVGGRLRAIPEHLWHHGHGRQAGVSRVCRDRARGGVSRDCAPPHRGHRTAGHVGFM